MLQSQKIKSELEKWVTKKSDKIRKICHGQKNVLNLENVLKLEKQVRARKTCHSQGNVSLLQNVSQVEKCVKAEIKKMGHQKI